MIARQNLKITRLFASYLPAIVAVCTIAGFGILAETKTRELHCHLQREAAAEYLGGLKSRIEDATLDHIGILARFAATLASSEELREDDLASAAEIASVEGAMIQGVALLLREDEALVGNGSVPPASQLRQLIAAGDPDVTGAQHLPGSAPQTHAIWTPVIRSDADGERSVLGQAVLMIDSEKLFVAAGLRDVPDMYRIALTENVPTTPDSLRGVLLGNPGLGSEDPIQTRIRIPGGEWMLEIAPQNGWATANAAVLPVRSVTLAAAIMVGVLLLYMRHLVEGRLRGMAALSGKERELSATTRRLELALRSARIGVFDFNTRTTELIWDSTIREQYDIPSGQKAIDYQDWVDRVHPDDRAEVQAKVWDAIDRRQSLAGNIRILDRHGAVRHIDYVGDCTTEPDGTLHLFGLTRDVTSDFESRRELELRQKACDDAAETRARLFAVMSHEIRTPLSGILGILDLMRRGRLDPEQRDRANLIHSASRQLHAIVSDCLDLSTLQAAEIRFQPEGVDVRAMAAEVISLLSATNASGHVRFSLIASELVPSRVACDPMRLRQVLTNLVGNAVRYTDEGIVTMRLDYDTARPGSLLIAVEDTGIGISEEDLPAIFDRFVRARDAKAQNRGGTGLGLAICKEIVSGMGGEIAVQSKLGLGTTFELRVPAPDLSHDGGAAWDGGAMKTTAPGLQPRAADDPHTGPAPQIQVLAALGSAAERQEVADCLRRAGCATTFASNESGITEELRAGIWDLILLDLDHPRIDTIAVAREIRQLPVPKARLLLVAIARCTSAGLEGRCRSAGIDELLRKPLDLRDLDAVLDEAGLRQKAPAPFAPPPGGGTRTWDEVPEDHLAKLD